MPVLALLLSIASASACEEPVSVGQIGHILDVATTAWVVMDRSSFEAATQERRDALPCLSEHVAPELAIQLHLHEALAWSIERRSDLSQGAFRAILALQPDWELPLEMAPERHRLRTDYDEAHGGDGEEARRPFAPPGDGGLLVDGLPSRDVPAERPFVVQMLDRHGDVLRTHYFTPGSEAPQGPDGLSWWAYEGESAGLADSGATRSRVTTGRFLLGGAAGTGLLAGGLYAVATVRGRAMERGEVDCDALPGAQTQINQLVGASVGLGAVGVGLGVSGVILAF